MKIPVLSNLIYLKLGRCENTTDKRTSTERNVFVTQ